MCMLETLHQKKEIKMPSISAFVSFKTFHFARFWRLEAVGLDPSSATAHSVFLVRGVWSWLSQMAEAQGPGKGRNLGGLGI